MKKKVVSLLLVGVLAMSTFVGCGSKGSSDATSDDSSSDDSSAAAMYTSDDENTLTVAAWDASFNIPAIEAAAKAYKEKNPDAKIEIIEQSQSKDIENAVTTAARGWRLQQLTGYRIIPGSLHSAVSGKLPGCMAGCR